MADELKPIILTFGYGINRRSRPQDIDEQECYDGENFELSHEFFALHRRDAFSLVSIAPNGQEIRGFAQLVNRDSSVSTLIQAGGDIYHLTFDDGWAWTQVGTVLPTARLRGPRSHNWMLDQYVIITDLEKIETVKKWDGTLFSEFPHNLTSDLKAKFCRVHGERAYIGNVTTTIDTPHVILASELDDAENLTVTDRPASALNDSDPFYLPTPDLRPINGIEKGFGQLFFSTTNGQLHRLSGSSAKDFELISFYEGSAVSGDEALLNIGNDILMGLEGRIETLSGTLNFGDVETDDASQWIRPLVENVRSWKLAYNRRLQKVYCIPDGGEIVWVLNKALLNAVGQNLKDIKSPWSKWTTEHDIAFNPSTMWSMICPCSNLERVFFGDQNGRIFAFEGSSGQDGAASVYQPSAVDLNGSTDYYSAASLTGISNSSTGIFAVWIKPDSFPSSGFFITNRMLFCAASGSEYKLYITINNQGFLQVGLQGSGAEALTHYSLSSIPFNQWTHVCVLWNTSSAITNNIVEVINGSAVAGSLGSFTTQDFNVDYATATTYQVGGNPLSTILEQNGSGSAVGVGKFSGCMSEPWFLPNSISASVDPNTIAEDIAAAFINANDLPLSPGEDGELVTGTEALVYLRLPPSRWHENQGTGGDFTKNGSPVPCLSNPGGTGGTGGGTPVDVTVYRRSKIIHLAGFDVFDIKGWITYLKAFPATVTLTFEYGGTNIFDQVITIQLPANPVMGVYNGDAYYNGEFYYNAGFEGRLSRQKFSAAGRASFCQVRIEISGAEDVEIHELGFWFSVAKDN